MRELFFLRVHMVSPASSSLSRVFHVVALATPLVSLVVATGLCGPVCGEMFASAVVLLVLFLAVIGTVHRTADASGQRCVSSIGQ